jgi:hypothetical protein
MHQIVSLQNIHRFSYRLFHFYILKSYPDLVPSLITPSSPLVYYRLYLHGHFITPFILQRESEMATTMALASSTVLYLPYEMRIADSACCSDKPNASRTCEGSILPEVQAELVETQTPFKSSKFIRDSPDTSSKPRFIVPGRRFSMSPTAKHVQL